MRFRAEQHLRRPSEIRAVREQGRRIECRAFTVWWKTRTLPVPAADVAAEAIPVKAAPAKSARVCVIASTAAVGNAVRRNRAKRRLRELFRHQQTAVPADCDLLLIARRSALESNLPTMEQAFAEACRRIGQERSS